MIAHDTQPTTRAAHTAHAADPAEPSSHMPLMPLEKALVGQTVRLEKVEHSDEKLAHRLVELGLTKGCRLEIINRGPGPFIVALRNSRLVLGRGMVNRMIVRPMI